MPDTPTSRLRATIAARLTDRAAILGDVSAGLTVAALVLPLSLGLAVTAGLPPERGLYASMLPLVAFAMLASTRRTMIGPDASVTALITATVLPLAAKSDAALGELVAALAIAAGIVCIVAALLGAGRLALLFNESSLIGYLAGLAIVVAIAQLPRMTGIGSDEGDTLPMLADVASRLDAAHAWSCVLAIATIVLVVLARSRRPALPWMLVAVVLAALVSHVLELDERGVAIIGGLPSGLPVPSIPRIAARAVIDVLPIALAIAAVTFADTMATASAFAARHGEAIRPGRDLVALGAADVVAGLSGGMPVSASGARTAAAEAAGGRSQAAGVVAAAAVAIVLLGGGSALSALPLPALGGVVVAAVIPMVDVRSLGRMRRLERGHFAGAALVMCAVVSIGVLEGILFALAVSVLDRIVRTRRA
jgi:MFS superfamily sulfate permease-like transporter